MQELVKVKGFDAETGDERWFHLPTPDADESWFRRYSVKVPLEYAGSRDEAKYYVREYLTDDKELSKLVDLPSNLCELNEFLTRWSELDKSQKQTTVALVEFQVEPLEAVALAEEGEAVLTDVKDCFFSDAAMYYAIGEYYFQWLDDCGCFAGVPEFCRCYFDFELFGRDIWANGGDGGWSEIYNRWLDYPQGTYKNRLWYGWFNK